MVTERELMLQISKRLSVYQLTKQVLWHGRLNSLHVKTIYGSRVKGHPKGTPDWLAIIRNKSKAITCLFIEAKSDTGKLRKEQIQFMDKYKLENDIQVLLIRDITELDKFIEEQSYDYIKDIKL